MLKPKICTIAVDSTLDGTYLGSVAMPYRGGAQKVIVTGHIDQITNIKVWSNNPRLLLSVFQGTYLSGLNTQTEIVSREPRIFFIGDKEHRVKLSGHGSAYGDSVRKTYATYIHNRLYEAEKAKLESSLSFKQYFIGDSIIALSDLRKLIQLYDQDGVYLWDPYLRSADILNTLFYSRIANVPLKAIGAIEKSSKKIYGKSGSTADQIIRQESNFLSNPSNNNYGLSLEFRMQHGMYGWSFHDRFLIFPGSEDTKPKVYSLGTSLNSIGQSHHILQEVSHPQRVIDAFNELWRKLNHKDCLVWKSTKI